MAPSRRKTIIATAASIIALVVLPLATTAQVAPLSHVCQDVTPAQLDLTAGYHPFAISPVEGQQTVVIDYTYRAPAAAWSIEPIEIRFEVTGEPPWSHVVLSEKVHHIELETGDDTEVSDEITMDITVDARAPAYHREKFKISAETSEGTCVAPTEAHTETIVTPGFREHWSADFEQSHVQIPVGSTHKIPLTVENQGNGGIEVLLDTPEGEENTRVFTPAGLYTVGSEDQGQRNLRTLTIEYRAEETGTEEIHLVVMGRSVDQQDIELREKRLTLLVETVDAQTSRSVEELPLNVAPLLVVGVLAGILARRRS